MKRTELMPNHNCPLQKKQAFYGRLQQQFARFKGVATLALTALATAGLPVNQAQAQEANYPSRLVKLIVPFSAGGTPDTMSRSYAEKLETLLGQAVIVDNRPGATGAIGASAVAQAPADGYTLLLNTSAATILPWVHKQPYDFRKDFVPIAYAGYTPYVLTVSPKLPVQNLDEFIAYAKANPGKLSCGTYGVASPPHLALELLMAAADVDIVHVPYTNFGQALPSLLSGQLDCSIDPPTMPHPHVESGRIRAIAHTGSGEMALFPDIDAIAKRYPETEVLGWQAIFARSETPEPIRERLITEWQAVLADPKVQQHIRNAGFEIPEMSMAEFDRLIQTDHEKFGNIIKARNIQLN